MTCRLWPLQLLCRDKPVCRGWSFALWPLPRGRLRCSIRSHLLRLGSPPRCTGLERRLILPRPFHTCYGRSRVTLSLHISEVSLQKKELLWHDITGRKWGPASVAPGGQNCLFSSSSQSLPFPSKRMRTVKLFHYFVHSSVSLHVRSGLGQKQAFVS